MMTLTTVKDYCNQQNVSRQFVNDYVKKGKFQVLELPTFVELDGEKIEIGKQKFLKIPSQYVSQKKTYWSGNVSDDDYAEQMAFDATDDLELRAHIESLLKIQDEAQSAAYKTHLINVVYPIGHPKRTSLDTAFQNCVNLMMAECADIELQVSQLEKGNFV